MVKVTEEEFRDFVKRTISDLNPPDNFMGSEKMFAKVLYEMNIHVWLAGFMMRALVTLGPENAAMSIWATGFQMGREFEAARTEIGELNRLIPTEPPTEK